MVTMQCALGPVICKALPAIWSEQPFSVEELVPPHSHLLLELGGPTCHRNHHSPAASKCSTLAGGRFAGWRRKEGTYPELINYSVFLAAGTRSGGSTLRRSNKALQPNAFRALTKYGQCSRGQFVYAALFRHVLAARTD